MSNMEQCQNGTNKKKIGGWVGPRSGLDFLGRENFPSPARIRTLELSARSLVTISTELSASHFHTGSTVRQYFVQTLGIVEVKRKLCMETERR
jgi:hypothetical protein